MTDQPNPQPPVQPSPGRSGPSDAQMMMSYDANKKSPLVAYLLWFFLSGLGAHNFYLGRNGSAVGQLVLFVLGWLTFIFLIGFLFFAIWGVWVLIDAFLIPGWIRDRNNALAQRLGAQPVY